KLISSRIGSRWVTHLDDLDMLKAHVQDAELRRDWRAVKQHNKQALVELVRQSAGVDFDADMLFDVQVKRIHEYKRQLLNVLHVIHLYQRIRRGDTANMQPRCVLIGGKAAPGYHIAKLIIKLVNNVADVVNADPAARDWLRVAFLPSYRVTAMGVI